MQSLEAACEEAERIIKKAKYHPSSVPALRHQEHQKGGSEQRNSNTSFCIHSKLRELYVEECAKDQEKGQTNLRSSSLLLEKLISKEKLNTLIVNLYPGNKGYSFARRIKKEECQDIIGSSYSNSTEDITPLLETTMQIPYEEADLLRCIDNEELHPLISDFLEQDSMGLFYNGCVIAEIRDYRQSFPHFKRGDTYYVLLKPSQRTLYHDISRIVNENDLNIEERLALESQLLIATQAPLCLDPSPSVGVMANRIQHERQLLNTRPLRRAARKFSQVTANRKRKLFAHTYHRGLELYEHISRYRARTQNEPQSVLTGMSPLPRKPTNITTPIPVPVLELPPLDLPQSPITVAQQARSFPWTKLVADSQPHVVEEYIFETNQGPVNKIKLSILQRPSNLEYIGEMYLDRDHRKGENSGSACRFSFGTSYSHTASYRKQLKKIFTDRGRKPIEIKRRTPGAAFAQQAAYLAQQITQQSSTSTSVAQIVPGHLSNGSVPATGVVLLQGTQTHVPITVSTQNAVSAVPILQSQLQSSSQHKPLVRHSNPEINAIANNIMNSAQEFQQQAAANAANKSASSSSNNAAILSLLNSPSNHLNNAANAAVANAITNNTNAITIVGLAPQQSQALNHKLVSRKMALTNIPNSRLLGRASNQVTVSNNNGAGAANSFASQVQMNLLASQLTSPIVSVSSVNQGQQPQAFTLTSLSGSNVTYATLPINSATTTKPINNHSARLIAPSCASPAAKRMSTTLSPNSTNSESVSTSSLSNSMPGLQALLKGTAAADHPIPGANSESVLLERIRASSGTSPVPSASPTQFGKSTTQFTAQSPKNNTVVSPMSSPPPQVAQPTATGTLHSLNLTQLANLTGLQNEYVQVQIQGFSTPISLPFNVSTAGAIAGQPTSVLVTVPVTTIAGSSNANMTTGVTVTGASNLSSNTTPMVQLSALLASGVKGNVRNASGQQLQVVGTLQRPRSGSTQFSGTARQTLTPRGVVTAQRSATAPIRMAVPTTAITGQVSTKALSGGNVNVAGNSVVTLSGQPQQLQLTFQKQAQLQQLQQCITQQQLQQCIAQQQQQKGNVTPAAVATKYRRRSNAADPNK